MKGNPSGWRRLIEADSDVRATLILRSWSLFAGAATLLLIPKFLTADQQGFYFTFASVIAVQIFFDLGFNYVILQLASRATALSTPAQQRHRLSELMSLSQKWYARLALGYFFIVVTAGYALFRGKAGMHVGGWLGPWIVLCALSALNLSYSPILAIFEGAGRVTAVALLRAKQSALGYMLLWLLLVTSQSLWAVCAVPAVACICTAVWCRACRNQSDGINELSCNNSLPAGNSLRWRTDILPLQWRLAVSWISGYLLFQAFNPLLFANQGAQVAGQVGLALSAFTAIQAIGSSWTTAKVPLFAQLVSQERKAQLNVAFKQALIKSTAATAVLSSAFLAAALWASVKDYAISHRLPEFSVLSLLGIAAVLNTLIGGLATYMRCHHEEPMLAVSATAAVLSVSGVWWASHHDIVWVFSIYLGVMLFLTMPWTIAIFRRYWVRNAAP